MRLLVTLLALAVSAAQAEDIRYPAKGMPALAFHTPAKWTSETVGLGDLVIVSDDRATVIVVSILPTLGSPDALAARLLKGMHADAPSRKQAARLAGVNGFSYRSKLTNPAGVKLNVKLVTAEVVPKVAFAVIEMSAWPEGGKTFAPADGVLAGMTLLGK